MIRSTLTTRRPCSRRHHHLADRALDRRRGGLAQAADRRVAHRLPDLPEQLDLVAGPSHWPVGGEPGQELLLPDGADPAGHALATRLVAEEGSDPAECADHVRRLVE